MTEKKMRAARTNGLALGITKPTNFNPDCTKPLGEFQADFITARFHLDGVRARVVAELAWGRA